MARIIIPDKICPRCGGNEWIVSLHGYYRCSPCKVLYNHNYALNQRLNNSEELKKRKKKWADTHKEFKSEYTKKGIKNLANWYITAILKQQGVSNEDITEERILEYRKQAIEKREYTSTIPKEIRIKLSHDKYNDKNRERYRIERKTMCDNLEDAYVRRHHAVNMHNIGVPVKIEDVTSEEIIKVRTHLQKVRTLKKVKQMQIDEKESKPERLVLSVTTPFSKKEIEKLTRSKTERLLKLEDLHSYLDPTVTLSISTNVRDNRRCALRKQLGVRTIEEVEKAIDLLKKELANEFEASNNLPTTVAKFEELIEISEPKVINPKVEESTEDIVDEFKRLEARRQEILQEVEAFNNYVESFKINLS